ncbi:MAG: hypothetical protein IT249_20480 [Chitinophagaceae bacterium]|nr:hypothetical protein [Chitinophagaceae bacterium]
MKYCITALFGLLLQLSFFYANAQDSWPKELTSSDGKVISVFEPQPEKYVDNNITARAAVSIRKTASADPVFGVMWFNAILSPAGNNTATVSTITVTKSKFADGDDASTATLKSVVESGVPSMNIRLDLKRLNDMLQQEADTESGIQTDPPVVYYRNKPTTLIVIDGEPVEQLDDDLKVVRVVNSPYLIIKNPDDNRYYLYGGNFWYTSTQVKSGWVNVTTLPSRIKTIDAALKEQEEKEENEDKETEVKFTTPTDILISTEPAELVQTEGEPTYKAVEGSTLLYVDNSLDEIFKDVESQKDYILLSGRWYASSNIQGPWKYVPSDRLPAAFASIPKGSEKDGVLSSVAGTAAAEESIMDAHIPQTAKVERSSAKCTVTYDGAPKFVPIENTNLMLAENSNITVMLAPNNQYYALENGIWFKSNNANGPWEVANERPSDVEKIPASSSAYNTKYVHVYYTTPQYVFVGYTPGYLGSFRYHHTMVWGTGWRYRPWHGHWYYPRPFTWGFGMMYSPWSGWNMDWGLSFNFGWFHYRRYYGHGWGWFGPPMFRPPFRSWGWNGGFYGNRPNRPIRHPNVITNRPPNWNNRPAPRIVTRNNVYNNRPSVITRDRVIRPAARPANTATRPVTTPGNNQGTRPGNNNQNTRPGTTKPARPTSPRPGTNNPSTRPGTPSTRPGTPSTTPGTRRQAQTKPAQTRPAQSRPAQPVKKPAATRPAERRRSN